MHDLLAERLSQQLAPSSWNSTNDRALKSSIDLNESSFPALPLSNSTHPLKCWKPKVISAQVTERFEIPSKLLAKQQFGKQASTSKICKDVMTKFKTVIEYSTNQKSQSLTLLVSGTPDSVEKSKQYLLNSLMIKTTEEVEIPSLVRPSLLGKQGETLKRIQELTATTIQVPKFDPTHTSEDNIIVSVTGSKSGITYALQLIDNLVSEKTSNFYIRVPFNPRFQQLLCGYNRRNVDDLQIEFDVKIQFPKVEQNVSSCSEFSITGERSMVLRCKEKMLKLLDNLVDSTKTLSISIPKKQHKLIIGPKGRNANAIFEKTGCVVEIPTASEISDQVVIRGAENNLKTALAEVLEYANSVLIGEVDVEPFFSSKLAKTFAKYLFQRERADIQKLEAEHESAVFWRSGTSVFDIESKSQSSFDACCRAFKIWACILAAQIEIIVVEIPSNLHKFVIGRNGQNLQKMKSRPEWKGQLVDIVIPSQANSDDFVTLIFKKAVLQDDRITLEAMANLVQNELLSDAVYASELVSQTIKIDAKYNGRLIGAKGKALKEFLVPYEKQVSINFFDSSVTIKGVDTAVQEVVDSIQKSISDWERVDRITGFSVIVDIPPEYIEKLVGSKGGSSGKDVQWIINGLKDLHSKDIIKFSSEELFIAEELLSPQFHHLKFLPVRNESNCFIKITGPKALLSFAKQIIQDRLRLLENTVEEIFNVFENLDPETERAMNCNADEKKLNIIGQLIGKDGKNIQKLSEKYNVKVRIYREADSESDEDAVGTINISGSAKDVKDARLFLQEFVNEKLLNAFEARVEVPRSIFGTIMGRGGIKLNEIIRTFLVSIEVVKKPEADTVEFQISGSESAILRARDDILEIVNEIQSKSTETVLIPFQLHGEMIGPSGATIKAFIEANGGTKKIRITFPKSDLLQNNILITTAFHKQEKVKSDLVELATSKLRASQSRFQSILHQEDPTTMVDTISFSMSDSRFVFGKNYENLLQSMRKFGVTIWVTKTDEMCKVAIVAASRYEKEIMECKEELRVCLFNKSRISIEKYLSIPVELQKSLIPDSPNSDFVKEQLLRVTKSRKYSNFDISINEQVLLGESTDIRVRGESGAIDQAIMQIKAELCNMVVYSNKAKTTCIEEILFPRSLQGHLIGKKGFVIAKIQTESKCRLKLLPNTEMNGMVAVSIRGESQQNVDRAKFMINEIVESNRDLIPSKHIDSGEPSITRDGSTVAGLTNHNRKNVSVIKGAVTMPSKSAPFQIGLELLSVNNCHNRNQLESFPFHDGSEYISQTKPIVEFENWNHVSGKKSARTNSAVSTGSSILHSIPFTASAFALMEASEQKKKRNRRKKKTGVQIQPSE